MTDKHIVLAGGSGFIGNAMAARWAENNRVTILTRGVKTANNSYGSQTGIAGNVDWIEWDARTTGAWVQALEGCDVLINLAGRTVNCRYNEDNKAEIMSSRIDSTTVLGEAVAMLNNPPELSIQITSATIYRHAEDRPQDEYTGEMEDDFSVRVCKAWENAFNQLVMHCTRKVILRTAIVLGKGGVLVPYSFLARTGLGGKHGSGNQMVSWIHIDDVCGIAEWMYEHKDQEGTYNAAAPGPLPNHEFMRLLRQQYHRQVGIPAPAWLLEIAAFIHRTETELLLKSRWVLPTRLQKEGYIFQYPDIQGTLQNLIIRRVVPKQTLLPFKIIDLLAQILIPILSLLSDSPFGRDYGPAVNAYFTLGGVQVVSCILNRLLLPATYKSKGRSLYELHLLVMGAAALCILVPGGSNHELMEMCLNTIVFLPPFMAIMYLTMTVREILKLKLVTQKTKSHDHLMQI